MGTEFNGSEPAAYADVTNTAGSMDLTVSSAVSADPANPA
jgi:hypothetical protein